MSFKNIKTHKGKDADHDLTREEWHQLPDALKYPFAVTRYNDANDRFRLYVNVMHNGNYVAVGVDVKRLNQGRELPMLEVNSIKTVFAHHGEIGGSEKLITYDKEITPEQEALLRGLNFREYPTIPELSTIKVVNNTGTASISGQKVDESARKAYTYEVTKIEPLDSTDGERTSLSSSYQSNSNGTDGLNSELEASSALAKLLQDVGKAYEKDKNLLDESKIADERTDLYRDPDEVGDILNDQSLGSQERITATAADVEQGLYLSQGKCLPQLPRARMRLKKRFVSVYRLAMDATRQGNDVAG